MEGHEISVYRVFAPKDIALMACVAALYAVLCFFPISPIVGLPSKAITAAAIMAPVIGMILGPYFGSLAVFLGGAIGLFGGAFSLSSLVAGTVAAVCGGMLRVGKRSICILIYSSLVFLFGFYPFVGPVWLFPLFMWFQIVGFLILVSPVQSLAVERLNSHSGPKLAFALFVTALTSTLAGQIAGSLAFEVISWPIFIADTNVWRLNWQLIAFLYPIERTLIALAATLVGVPLLMVLRSANFMADLNRAER